MKAYIVSTLGSRGMLRASLEALLVLAVAVGVAQGLVVPLVEDSILEPVRRWEGEYLNGGTIELLAQELNATPADQIEDRLAVLAPEFGFDMALRDLSTVSAERLGPDGLRRLRGFEPVADPADYSVYKLLNDGQRVLVFEQTNSTAAHLVTEAQRRSMGTLHMLELALQGEPESEWAAIIQDIAPLFEFPVALRHGAELPLSASQRTRLDSGAIVTVTTSDSIRAEYPAEWVFKQVGSHVLVLGPFSPPILKRFYSMLSIYYLILGLGILVPIGLWLAPTWRSMSQLSKAALAFGKGNFAVRVKAVRNSKTGHLVDAFNQMANKIQSLVESNKALVNAVSHELRTPLSRIEFNVELARQSTDSDERNRQLDRVEDSVDELKAMVSEMLQYARFDREKPSFSMESVALDEWLRREYESWKHGKESPAIHLEPLASDVQVCMERYYMSRAVGNLVRNALRFAVSRVVVSATLHGRRCRISVADDGPGVDHNERTRIFEPFIRLDHSRNRDSGGTGLGLAIVKQIAAWHAGDAWVELASTGGAVFIIEWPGELPE